ncbi:MAG TPA: TROVE domain-containing protein [Urbifossiella sp.]|nr:TROVE domain-containing protein [Urbifossiella sp.]
MSEISSDTPVAHRHVPGSAYDLADPVTKLVNMVGGGFFNEPRYYDPNRPPAAFLAELLTTGKIATVPTDDGGLSAQAREVVETAAAVARGDTPEDLLVIAAWARDAKDGLKLRATPQVLLAVAAASPKTRGFVPRYAPAVIQRADEIRQVFGVYRDLFMAAPPAAEGQKPAHKHRGALPHGLRKALALALATQSDFALLKYNGGGRPTFADVLLMVGGSAKIGTFLRRTTGKHRDHWPVGKAMFEFLVNDRYVADGLPPILAARQRFFATKNPADVTPELIREAGLTWENVVSHLGNAAAVWELCLPVMGEMALTRNLRNFEQAGISAEAWDRVEARLLAVEESVQLPFRYFAAEREVTTDRAKALLAKLMDNAVAKLADLPGDTLVLVDNSGSALGCAVSKRSDLRVSDAGNTLAAVLAKRLGSRCRVGVFGDSLVWVPLDPEATALALKKRIDAVGTADERSEYGALAIPTYRKGLGVGGGTETGLWFALHDVTEKAVRFDRVIFLSDLCCYTQGDDGTAANCGVNLEKYFGKGATVQVMVERYRAKVNPTCRAYSVNLAGYGQSQLAPGDARSHLLSGWSDKVVDLIRGLEAGGTVHTVDEASGTTVAEPVSVPVIDVLRERYRR